MVINLVLALFSGVLLILSAFSRLFQRASLPGPVLALASGVLIGPFGLDLLRIEDFGLPAGTLLEQAARITLAIGLTGVALRLPHGYWRRNVRWFLAVIGLGMALMFVVATGVLWALLGVPFLIALLLGAILTPTDPVVTTPIVTGSLAEEKITERVRHNLSAESGINDGAAYLFVFLPVLLMTEPGQAWHGLLTRVLLWEVLAGAVFGALVGWLLGRLFVVVKDKGLMEESSYLGFLIPLGLAVLGAGKLLGFDALLSVFVAAAVFGQTIPQRDEEQEDRVQDAISRLFLLPIFILLGMALPLDAWVKLGWIAVVVLAVAVLGRRLVTLWLLRPLLTKVHDLPETFFLSWFGPIGVSALFYATLAERHTGNHEIFVYTTLAVTISVVVHGISTVPMSTWLRRQEPEQKEKQDTPA
ncbi:cation:proton antiporter [Corynebacterium halotolerans]|uniref:Sodium/hydrogen exchanger n=1 Tax=Corynebacterium halotolerans YIM 70093 = DSM 44683 TaxID=1121362 RepID=M1P9D1_9CORY|nr:cation:proton antiporter [Corynebacterium halotolerans]AGF73286.1 sodium/hydrogen exchanger [Corynebacterium halotolerans YIM 70093 = DSM 44683]